MRTCSDSGLKHIALLGTLMLAAVIPHVALAALGGPESTVSVDAQQLKGSIKSTERTAYRLHEIKLPSGTTLREYAGAGGIVFAVAWDGPSIPDLRQALGSYFDVYLAAARTPHSGHTRLQIRQDDFVMQVSGHMRAFSGRAYLPQSVPAEMSLTEIK